MRDKMRLLGRFSVWIDGYVTSSWSHSFLLWLICCCCFSESKEHHRRYNTGTRHSGNHHSVPAENLVPQEPPAFESTTPVNVTVEKGQAAFLHCKIKNQGDYTVSWVRYVRGDFNIVAIGTDVFIPDNRFSLVRIPGSADWTLRIVSVRPSDEGSYECQIGTTPKMGRNITLQVIGRSLIA
ncbi:hypothetical protein RvY_14581-2 [Ramazzottius varieornatus]|uniref:Ig-like domain-containing protein n=1 Tax=Ramazzottius varieornatus TaxID=947166 RepID=A0A1D1W096_RAMVA|nr:hypothetical protein RvY_14581-2 [Ramazzottius varieornatus]